MNFNPVALYNHYFKKEKQSVPQQPASSLGYNQNSIINPWTPIRTEVYNGEKTLGELGNIVNLLPDYNGLRLRAYEQYLKSDIVRIITGKFFKWVVGSGLDLQAEPQSEVLESEGIDISNLSSFSRIVEARFKIYANSKHPDYAGMANLHKRADEAFQTSWLGGDCLAVLRVVEGRITIQNYDGQCIESPFLTDPVFTEAKARGNTIQNGIEIDSKETHVAFYVRIKSLQTGISSLTGTHIRIEARSPQTGCLMAWMVYGSKFRINHHRGISNLSSVLEKIDKLDRYTEATVGSAEERAKIPFFIEHSRYSDGENPMGAKLKAKIGGNNEIDPYTQGETLATAVAATTAKTVHNMPIGSKLNAIQTQNEIQYEPFFRAVFNQICAALDCPPEVAMQLYNSNYSASRAAINGWGYIVNIYRTEHALNYYKNFYSLWLTLEILNNKIKADGFLKALLTNNYMIIEAYTNCRFMGANMPHIDPLKEVKYVREMLGNEAEGITPLISREQATELLNQGSWYENYKKYEQEEELLPEQPEEPNEETGIETEKETKKPAVKKPAVKKPEAK